MSEDRFKDAGHFHPARAWEKITRTNKARAFDAKHPLTWWDRFWIPTSIVALLLGLAGCAIYLLIWGLSSPFA
jgi:hypothetical protein